MLSLSQPSSSTKSLTPNLLPCTIHHSGPIDIPKRYWDPQTTTSKTNDSEPKQKTTEHEVAHLRGRKLLGRKVKLPAGYTGVVAQKTERTLPSSSREQRLPVEYGESGAEGEEEEDEEESIEIHLLEQTGTFSEFVVWGHEAVPEGDDPYVRGVEEWIGFAEEIHSYDEPGRETKS